jgi:hypothetical protein
MSAQELITPYSNYIAEAFIKPISSVLAIDDLFPTLDTYLNPSANLYAEKDVERLRQLVAYCRQQDPQWLVDVHDGKNMGAHPLPIASMRQCDCLILDFKLDGDAGGGGKAIEIIRRLAGSDHFNLVVIYTAEPLDAVLSETAVSLSNSCLEVEMPDAIKAETETRLESWEDKVTEIRSILVNELTHGVRLALLKNGLSINHPNNAESLKPFLNHLEGSAFETVKDRETILQYLLKEVEERENVQGAQRFSIKASNAGDAVRWILVENVFLAIVGKDEVPPDQLIANLQAALVAWNPSPNRLILAKIRAELDARGIRADREILGNRNLQAFWLKLLLQADERELFFHVQSLVDRQTELLTDRVKLAVAEFTRKAIAEARGNGNVDDAINHFWGNGASKQVKIDDGMAAHNTHVSTKPPGGKNLSPGHVLRIMHDGNPSYWICLSPACDLVAGRDTGRDLKKRIKPWMPFTAVKLHPIAKISVALALATTGSVLFPIIDGERRAFSFYPDANASRNPIWEEFFAKDDGRLLENELRVAVVRIIPPSLQGALPSFEEGEALIVAQLRDEYAASLTLKLTHHLSRIGLDYHAPNPNAGAE